jgi:hypothetical protein
MSEFVLEYFDSWINGIYAQFVAWNNSALCSSSHNELKTNTNFCERTCICFNFLIVLLDIRLYMTIQ